MITSPTEAYPLLLDVSKTTLHVTPQQFDELCLKNPDLRLELTATGELIVMPPTFSISGQRNGELFGQVWYWNKQTKLGQIFDSSSGYDFTAIGGGKLSPDVSWIEKSRLEGISLEQFCPVVPDFVIELRSTTDNLTDTQKKMVEYQQLGVRLGLLVNPQNKQVEIYRAGGEIEVLEFPLSLVENLPSAIDCGDVLPGFVLSMTEIW
jgi:Uma2 family endonuclease